MQANQISMFDGNKPFKINKPIRLIELFAGYGSQALALKYLGVPFEHHKICEWAIKSIQAYKDMHFYDDNTDYSKSLSKEQIYNKLFELGISSDYNTPMSLEKIHRLGENKARIIYNNIKATNNLVSVCNIRGGDLNIKETNKYCYIMTYSFPCQDLSNAGKKAGMEKDSGTRSGLLWEVERLLSELDELPQVLLMENVPEVIGKKNIKHFAQWLKRLDEFGYHSKWQILNATDFNVPQNRERCFMVSILGDYFYDFPRPIGCEKRLKDVLENNVGEEYYLKPETVYTLIKHKEFHDSTGHGFGWKPIDIENNERNSRIAHTIKCDGGDRSTSNFIIERLKSKDNIPPIKEVVQANGIDIGKSKAFFKGELENISRTLRTDNQNGVVEWKD